MLTAVFRRLGQRGAFIVGLTALALAIALVVGLLGWSISNVQPPSQPSPSNAILAMTRFSRSDGKASSLVHAGVSARNGAIIWSKSFPNGPNGAVSVASVDGVYYMFAPGASPDSVPIFTAYRMSDGAQLWSMTSPAPTPVQQPLLVTHGLLLFSASNWPSSPSGTIYALDVTTHALAWHATVPDGVVMAYPEIAANASMLFVASVGNALQPEISVTALRLSDGAVAWRQPVSSSLLVARGPARWLSAGPDAVYVADSMGDVVAMRQSDGAVVWRSQPATTAKGGIQLMYSGSTLYVCATNGASVEHPLLALDPANGDTRWRESSGSCSGQLIELNGVVYLAEQDLIARRASDGSLVWRVSPLSSGLGFLSMRVDAGVVVAAASVTGRSSSVCSINVLPGQTTQCQDTGYLAAFNGASGAPYWRVTMAYDPLLISDGWFTVSRPVYAA